MNETSRFITVSPRLLSLAQTLDDLLRHKKSGAALPECYGDEIGAKNWAHFVRKSDPNIQYTFQSEVNAIYSNGAAITNLIKNDPDLDISRLIVIEKGGGSREARLAKPLALKAHTSSSFKARTMLVAPILQACWISRFDTAV